MDTTYKHTYKNAEIEIIVEDDMITTAKVFVDKSLIESYDIGDENGAPNNKKVVEEVLATCRERVDKYIDEIVSFLPTPAYSVVEA